jgi:VWFA-related protein
MNSRSRQMRRRLFFVAVVSAAAISAATTSPVTAQQAPSQDQAAAAPPAQEQPVAVIRKESKLVLVDAVVTDKKGNYVHDLTQKDFKVYEDNKEQQVASFSTGADVAIQANNGQKRYLILFFDTSSMAAPDQIQARAAATKFVDANAGPDHLMAVVDFSGTLHIAQNFTANADTLHAAVNGFKTSYVASNSLADAAGSSSLIVPGSSSVSTAETSYGARTMLLSVRSLAKNLSAVPGRKMLVLFSAGFVLDSTTRSELTATIDACNKANVAIYSLDVRGLVGGGPTTGPGGGSATNFGDTGVIGGVVGNSGANGRARNVSQRDTANSPGLNPRYAGSKDADSSSRPRFLLASYSANALPDPQHPVGGGGSSGGGAGGGHPVSGGGTGGTGTGGTGTKGGTGTGTGTGTTGKGGGTTGTPGGTRGVTNPTAFNPYANNPNNPYNQSRNIVPQFPESVTTNQQVLAALADGTGGFSIFNTNDLLGGLERIGREQNEFYILGYVPGESPEGSCHTLKVKMNRGGLSVRSRSGFCNARSENPLAGKPVEKQLELRAAGSQTGSIHGAMEAPYFYTAPNIARVNLAMEIPSDALKFDKEKGKYHANINVLGIAYRPDGSVGARFNDTVNLDLEKDEWKAFTQAPYRYQNQFDAGAGTYKLTVVLSGGGDTFGKFETPLQIDSYDGKSLSLGGVVLTNSATRVSDIPTGLDSVLLEDRTPLVVQGMQMVPSATNRFKRSDNVALYTEIYDPLLTSEKPPKVVFAYRLIDRATNKEVFFTGAIAAEPYIEKGNPVIPVGVLVKAKDLPPGGYRMVVQAVDSAKNSAPNRTADFDVTD